MQPTHENVRCVYYTHFYLSNKLFETIFIVYKETFCWISARNIIEIYILMENK